MFYSGISLGTDHSNTHFTYPDALRVVSQRPIWGFPRDPGDNNVYSYRPRNGFAQGWQTTSMFELMAGVLAGPLSVVVVEWVSNNPIIAAILVGLLVLFFFLYLLVRRTVMEFKEGLRGGN